MKPPLKTPLRILSGLVLLAASTTLLPACDDPIGVLEWSDAPDTVSLHSLARTDHMGEPAAYDLYRKQALRVEETGSSFNFDFAISEQDGQFVLLPAGVFAGFDDEAGIQVVDGTTFEALERVPSDGYTTEEPVAAEVGTVYAVRTRRIGSCHYFGKIQVLELGADGVVEIQTFRNPRCNDRSLEPTVDDD